MRKIQKNKGKIDNKSKIYYKIRKITKKYPKIKQKIKSIKNLEKEIVLCKGLGGY